MTLTRSLPTQPEDTESPAPKAKRFGLSWTQIMAAGFASITATVILSFFSISGTLIGAAVFSMASAVGNAVYGQSLRNTQDRVLDVLPVGKADPASPTVVLPVTGDDEPAAADDEPKLPSAAAPGTLSRRAWKRIALTALTIFAFVISVVTAVELIAGRPLTDVLRGDQGSGTSLFGGTTDGGAAVPTVTVTVTPTVVTTPTITQTAPPTTTTTPSATTTAPSTSGTGTSAPASPTVSGSATTGSPSPSQSTSP